MNTKKILLVEDNDSDIELTKRAFIKNNISNALIVAHTGKEALDYLLGADPRSGKPLNELPAVILMDLKLPAMDGLETLRKIRAHERSRLLPVVILTCSKQEEDLIQSYLHGANSYIRKPVDFLLFAEAIRQLGMYWLLLNEPPPEK